MEILKWARKNGCPWSERTCSNAAASGKFEVLKWARQNGCPMDSGLSGWILVNGCKIGTTDTV